MSGDKKDNIFYITHSGELLIWLVIILIVVAVSTITYVSNTQKDNDYNIFMSDVDGLIVGSPVRMMGIEVRRDWRRSEVEVESVSKKRVNQIEEEKENTLLLPFTPPPPHHIIPR